MIDGKVITTPSGRRVELSFTPIEQPVIQGKRLDVREHGQFVVCSYLLQQNAGKAPYEAVCESWRFDQSGSHERVLFDVSGLCFDLDKAISSAIHLLHAHVERLAPSFEKVLPHCLSTDTELTPCWDKLSRIGCDETMFAHAINNGVKRGLVHRDNKGLWSGELISLTHTGKRLLELV